MGRGFELEDGNYYGAFLVYGTPGGGFGGTGAVLTEPNRTMPRQRRDLVGIGSVVSGPRANWRWRLLTGFESRHDQQGSWAWALFR